MALRIHHLNCTTMCPPGRRLMDGRKDTAWNGATGNLQGAWIAFRVPKDAHVDYLEMTAGFDKQTPALDLFTANHRIKRLNILHDGKKLRDVELDVADRSAQRIPVDADGGDFKIEVAETVPGTKAEWREIVVSEPVVGEPHRARQPPEDLRVRQRLADRRNGRAIQRRVMMPVREVDVPVLQLRRRRKDVIRPVGGGRGFQAGEDGHR